MLNVKVKIKKGWENAGKEGITLGKNVYINQWWTPIKWDEKEDPDWIKTTALIFLDIK